jgi:hypothetical protein
MYGLRIYLHELAKCKRGKGVVKAHPDFRVETAPQKYSWGERGKPLIITAFHALSTSHDLDHDRFIDVAQTVSVDGQRGWGKWRSTNGLK